MSYVYIFLGWIMDWCYGICHNYGLAIILFTFCSKIVLLPVSLWTYFNSITMIKIQPDINFIKVKYYGQKDEIADEQAKLFKEKKYHPLASIVPTIVQLFLLAGVVGVIKLGMTNPDIDMTLGSINLGWIPSEEGIHLIWSPIIAGLSSWILCISQNASNVLQSEQSKMNKYGTMVFSVGLSLYLGWFVSIGTAFYWVCSNLMAVLQMYICNWIIKPRKYVDYEKLEESRKQLAELQGIGKQKKESYFSENRRKERADYKRFFSVVNKHLVFYSESNGFYKYFKGIIEYILENTNITIHYITSDPNDKIFEMEKQNPQIRGYYIGENKLITLMMKMDADVVCMTMPDLDNYHIKRSYVRKDIEYIFIPHGIGSINLMMRKGCVDNFDTIFCLGQDQKQEILQMESVYNLKKKNLVEFGYPLIDEMKSIYKSNFYENSTKKLLIAPSWQKDNIIDSCLETILDRLIGKGYEIIVRPHPQHIKHKKEYFEILKDKYKDTEVEIQTDFSLNNPIMESDILITDWSGICWEYAFTTFRPVLFINTPMKIMNADYERINVVPLNILLRDKIGKSVDMEDLDLLEDTVKYLIDHKEKYKELINKNFDEYVYNHDCAAEIGGQYIIGSIQRKINKKNSVHN